MKNVHLQWFSQTDFSFSYIAYLTMLNGLCLIFFSYYLNNSETIVVRKVLYHIEIPVGSLVNYV